MKSRSPTFTVLLVGCLVPAGLLAQSPPGGQYTYNPYPFNATPASPSSHLRWGLSDMGKKWLSSSNQNNAQFLVNLANGKRAGSPANTAPNKSPAFRARQ